MNLEIDNLQKIENEVIFERLDLLAKNKKCHVSHSNYELTVELFVVFSPELFGNYHTKDIYSYFTHILYEYFYCTNPLNSLKHLLDFTVKTEACLSNFKHVYSTAFFIFSNEKKKDVKLIINNLEKLNFIF